MLKKIVVTLLFVLGIIVFGEVPHSYIWENPDKEVIQTETLKRYKDKAELNISVTKLKSEPIPMKHDIDSKKIYFELTSREIKRSDRDIKLEPTDRIFVSEKLEEVPSVSTTNGRKKINGLKRLNKSLDKRTLKNGNLTWTVKDLRTTETKKIVEINYGMFPKSLYVGITDKDYNLKKIFVGKMSDLELYNADDLAGYVSTYSEEPYITKGYTENISDLVIWTQDKKYVDIKFLEGSIKPISNLTEDGKNLIKKKPYLKVKGNGTNGTDVTLTKNGSSIVGVIHMINIGESSSLSLKRTEELKNKLEIKLNFTGDETEELKTAIYIRLSKEEFDKLTEGEYQVQSGVGLVYGYNNGTNESEVHNLPNMLVQGDTIGESKKITVDFWLFKSDFVDKVNYVLDPRNNGTGNLKIRVQDENSYVTNAVSAGATASVFDMQGRMIKFDYDDRYTEVKVENISGFTPRSQNQGSYDKNKNRWAEGSILGYSIRARIWSDYDGLELDLTKVGTQDISNEGTYSFKIVQTDTRYSKVIQEITVNLYVNNLKPEERAGHYHTKFSRLDLHGYSHSNVGNYFTDTTNSSISDEKKGKKHRTSELSWGSVQGPMQIQMVTKKGDLRHYFPLCTSRGVFLEPENTKVGARTLQLNANFYPRVISENSEYDTVNSNNGYYIGVEKDGKGLYGLKLDFEVVIPYRVVANFTYWTLDYRTRAGETYTSYGNGKRKLTTSYTVGIYAGKTPSITDNKLTFEIQGIPLLTRQGNNGKNIIFTDKVYKSYDSNELVTDNMGWFFGTNGNLPLHAFGRFYVNNNLKISDNIEENYAKYRYTEGTDGNLLYGTIRFLDIPRGVYVGTGIINWKMSKSDYDLGKTILLSSSDPNFGIPSTGMYQKTQIDYKVKAFDSTFMWDKTHSSIKEDVLIYLDINTEEGYIPTKQVIDIGEVYFKTLNIEALKTNTDKKVKFILPNTAYLEAKGIVTNNNIAVKLSFSPNEIKTTYEMEDKGGDYAGGNGTRVYLHIETDDYKKIIVNGTGQEYRVRGNYDSGSVDSSAQNNTNNIIQIGVVANKSPFNDRYTSEYFFNPVTDNLVLQTREVQPIVYRIKYKENSPMISGYELALINNKIEYTSFPMNNYNYNNDISLFGNVTPYNYFTKAHSYQIIDGKGSIRNGQIGSAGSGAYWENLAIDDVHIGLYHKRDSEKITVGGESVDTREVTFFVLQDYNYEKAQGKITEKHYKPYSREINQYYEINVDIPEFNPYVYYDETKSVGSDVTQIKLSGTFDIQRVKDKTIYILGSVATQNYDVEITKKSSGKLVDNYGLRIVPNNRSDSNGVTLYEVNENGGLGNPHSKKGRIIFVDAEGKEIGYSINSPNQMIGANQSIRVALEIPSDLNPQKNYRIIGTTDKILDKSKDIPNDFNLIIGRNKYFKEIIEEINLKSGKLEGSFTITFDNNYLIREMAKFKATTFSDRGQVELEEALAGVTLSSKEGEGFLQLESGDIFQVEVDGFMPINLSVPDSLQVDKQEFLLNDKATKMALKIVGGKVQIGLNYWKPNSENKVIFRVIRNSSEVMYQEMTLITPSSQFIVTHKENLDFGNVFQGTKDNYAEAKLEIENTGDTAEVNFEISDTTPTLENVNDDTKTLEVREINGALIQKEPNKYEMRVNGFLDVPKELTAGEYKGSIIIKLYIK